MTTNKSYFRALLDAGFDSLVGVPCSYFNEMSNFFHLKKKLYITNNEGEAIAFATGLKLSGGNPIVFFQNSGLGNAINPLTSLALPCKIPLLIMVSLRGDPELNDEPQHEIMGKVTNKILNDIGIKTYVTDQVSKLYDNLDTALKYQKKKQSFAIIIKKKTFKIEKNKCLVSAGKKIHTICNTSTPKKLDRQKVLELIKSKINSAIFVSSTGFLSRELFSLGDDDKNFYMVGAMGCSSAISLGIALKKSKQKVVCLDGDGALLMRTGVMSNISHYRPNNLIHILINNLSHESTGGQYSNSKNIFFQKLAEGFGYNSSLICSSLKELEHNLNYVIKNQGPHFIEVQVKTRETITLPRPSVSPVKVAARFTKFLEYLK